MKYLTDEARKISLKFSQKLTGKSEETPRYSISIDYWLFLHFLGFLFGFDEMKKMKAF